MPGVAADLVARRPADPAVMLGPGAKLAFPAGSGSLTATCVSNSDTEITGPQNRNSRVTLE